MAVLSDTESVFTVMVRVETPPERQQELVEISKRVAPVFARVPGFVSYHLHRGREGGVVISYLQWRSEDDHLACMSNPEVMAAGVEWMAFVSEAQAKLSVETFEVVSSIEN